MEERRVVITGRGVLSCVGSEIAEFWDNLVYGRCGLDQITRFDVSAYRTRIGGEVRNLQIQDYLSPKDVKRMDLFTQYAVVAAIKAMRDAGLPDNLTDSGIDPTRVGVVVSSGVGGLPIMYEQSENLLSRGPGRTSPLMVPMMISDMASGAISMHSGAKGPNMSIVTACATGTHSIGESFWMVKRGDADMMLAGGSEGAITQLGFAGFCAMKAMSQRNDDPKHASRPFDLNRDGFVMSEGAGVLVLEELEHAKRRGANILGEVVGYGATGDAYHITSPHPEGEGAARAIQVALKHAGINPDQIDYINAHGTSTELNDKYETLAIKRALGDHAYKVAISSTKGTMGHSLGAAGALESTVCLEVLRTGVIPPTINYETPDPMCDLNITPNQAIEREVKYSMNINLGFGGHNGVLIFKKL